ncbi:MAG: glucokinase [Spirochaeta sp.]|jgi:glucokinase|nr:glucokinase [Spirochaeta sp.]
MRQLGNRREYDSLILACDVGGTNTSVALVGRFGTRFDIVHRTRYGSQDLPSMEEGLRRGINEIEREFSGHRPDRICISGAGPVHENRCNLTNVDWVIDGDAITDTFGIPTTVINDFSAISYGIPLLDTEDPEQITPVPAADGQQAIPHGTVQAVVGAGTGLGVGYLVEHAGRFVALPSEGGHAAFAPYDELSAELLDFISDREGTVPGAELFVSGQGIARALDFIRETGRIPADSPLHARTSGDPAAAVSVAAAAGDTAGAEIMRLFVRNYARVASDAALHFLPRRGLFLAGGIVTKNESWFLEESHFIRIFTTNYREHIAGLLREIPVYIVKDYAISLYGAAHAAYALSMEDTPNG